MSRGGRGGSLWPRAGRVAVGVVVVAMGLLAAACVPMHPPPGSLHVSWEEKFVDTTRTTAPVGGTTSPSRTLVTAIYLPVRPGPHPLVLFSHGLSGDPEKFTALFSAWADAGYVVAAPRFPLTTDHVRGSGLNARDLVNQPGDVSFVLDQLLAQDRQPGSRLFGTIDERRIGAAGLSLGGATTYLLVYGACCRDDRIRAAAVLDGFQPPDAPVDGHVPLLVAHSDTDPVLPYSTARQTFDAAPPPAWLLTLHGASHASQWEDDVTPYDGIAERTTTDFWDATLRGDPLGLRRLERDATVPGLSAFEAKPCPSTLSPRAICPAAP